jgi:hypothetical protein
MLGSFNQKSLELFQEAMSESMFSDFSEGDSYDFTTCIRPDGSAYGTGGKCRKGTEGEAKSRESSITATPGMAAKVKAAKEKLKAEIAANGGKRTDRIQEERRLEQNRKQREMDRKEKAAAAARAKSPADLVTPQKQGKADADRIRKYASDEAAKLKALNDAQKQNSNNANDPAVASRKKILERNVAAANKELKDLEGKP